MEMDSHFSAQWSCLLSQPNVLHVQLPIPAHLCGHAQVSPARLGRPPRSHIVLPLGSDSSQAEAIFHMKLQDLWDK